MSTDSMIFPAKLDHEQADRYEEIFASGDGEALLTAWAAHHDSGPIAGPLDIEHLVDALRFGQLEFAAACLQVLPDGFFDLRQPVPCRDYFDLNEVIFTRLRGFMYAPEMAAPYHPIVELMVQRGWDVTYGTRDDIKWKVKPVLCHLADTHGCAPLLRRLLPRIGAEVVRRFSDSHADGLARSDFNHTLLHRAVDRRDIEMVRFLITEVGINPNTVDAQGRTALMACLWILSQSAPAEDRERGRAVVREVVRLGLNVDHRDPQDETALIYAVHDDNLEAARLLLQLGANHKVRCGDNLSLVDLAEINGHGEIARLFKSYEVGDTIDAAMPGDDEWTPPPSAVSGGFAL